jgi:PLD-like domain
VPGFDISSLVEFNPPASRCWLCLALWPVELDVRQNRFQCPGCESIYVSPISFTHTGSFTTSVTTVSAPDASDFFWSPTYGPMSYERAPGRKVVLGPEPMSHAVELAKLAVRLRETNEENPPLRVLMKLLLASRSFVHVTSFNFDDFMLALLEMAAQKTSIAAIVSGVDPKRLELLDKSLSEAPDLECRIEGTRSDTRDQNHGKLIVVDGLLAVIGSPNLTRPAWRKASDNMEIVEVVTDISRVMELNNRYFSPLWKRLQPDPHTRYSVMNWTIITPEDSERTSPEAPPQSESD